LLLDDAVLVFGDPGSEFRAIVGADHDRAR
jgi:hypothetical protein